MVKLGDVCTINPKSPGFQDELTVSFVPMPKVGENGEFDPSEIKTYQEVKKGFTFFQNGDVLFAKITPCMENGKGAIAQSLENGVGFGSTEFYVLRPHSEYVTSKWLFYLLSWEAFRKKAEKSMTGSAGQKRVPKNFLAEYVVNIPDLSTQEKMTDTLDKVCHLISLRKQQLAKLDELVKARFVEMFGDPRQNPMGWETPPLSKCLRSIDNGKSFVCKPEPRKGNWPAVLKLSAGTYGVFKPEENKAVLDANEFVKEAEVRSNDLLFTRKNTPELVGMSAYVFDTAPNLMMPDLIFRLNPNELCNKIFLWQLINHDLFRAEISGLASGSAQSMSNISKERLANLKIICPPMKLQQMFAKSVEQIHRQKLTIQQSLDKLEVLKKSLMQEYFGG